MSEAENALADSEVPLDRSITCKGIGERSVGLGRAQGRGCPSEIRKKGTVLMGVKLSAPNIINVTRKKGKCYVSKNRKEVVCCRKAVRGVKGT